MPSISMGSNSVRIYGILPKAYKVIYTSSPISTPNIKALAQIVVEIYGPKGKNAEKFKGPLYENCTKIK